MKNKIHKILGVGLTLVMLLALVAGCALPAAASPEPDENVWEQFEYPAPGLPGGWFRDASILGIGPMAEAINGDLYAAVNFPTADPGITIDGTLAAGEWDAALQVEVDTGDILYLLSDGVYLYVASNQTDCWLEIDWDGSGTFSNGDTSTNFDDANYYIVTDATVVAPSWFHGDQGEYRTCGYEAGQNTGSEAKWELAKFGVSVGDTIAFHLYDVSGMYSFPAGSTSQSDDFTDWYRYRLQVPSTLMKSTDGARTWAESIAVGKYAGGGIIDMVCSSIDEDILYVTDGNYVYKSTDAGDTFAIVAKDSLEEALMGACPIDIVGKPITSIDVGYDADDNPFLFIGTLEHISGVDVAPADGVLDIFPGNVYWIGEAGYPATWTDLRLECFEPTDLLGTTTYEAYSVGVAGDFPDSLKTFVVVSSTTDHRTFVVSTIGVTCSWTEVSELLQDCDPLNPFAIRQASRIGFPDDYADTETLFVGVVDYGVAPGGDVYMAMVTVPASNAIDMNVEGITAGCVGKVPATDILSLDVFGDTDEASLIAGANDNTNVYYSIDGGWSWDVSDKVPTGDRLTYVLWYGDSALAATAGAECAVSLSCGAEVGEYWNQISLIATDIDMVLSIDHSPEYLSAASETMFMLTEAEDIYNVCVDNVATLMDTQSLFRYDQTYWERVYCSTIAGADEDPAFWSVLVSPDFDTTEALYLANTGFELWRSLDAGCSWDKLTFPCVTRPTISAWVVIDEDTVITGGRNLDNDPAVFKTERHGARPWDEYLLPAVAGDPMSFDLEPGYEDPGIIILGDDEAQVFISEDGGEEWELVGAGALDGCKAILGPANPTWVAFDPGYATTGDEGEDTIYAASGDDIARSTIDWGEDMADQAWVWIGGETGDFYWGIETAGDTALYVTASITPPDAVEEGVWVSGTIAVRYNATTCDLTIANEVVTEISGHFVDGELVSIIEYNLVCIEGSVVGEIGLEGYDSGAIGKIDISVPIVSPCTACTAGTAIEVISSFLTTTVLPLVPPLAPLSGVLRSLNPLDEVEPTMKVVFERLTKGLLTTSDLYDLWLTKGSNVLWTLDSGNPTYVWTYDDTLAEPVIAKTPFDGKVLTTSDEVTLSWEELDEAEWYEVSLYRWCPECPEEKQVVAVADTEETCITVYGLEPGSLYYWQVRVALGEPKLSKWSEERTFTTALLAVPFAELCSPPCGAEEVILTPNFSWGAVTGATGYIVELASTEAFTTGVIRGETTVNAWASDITLDYATTYYWRVRAVKDGIYSDWTVCLFTTMAKPVPAPPPVVVEPTPPAPPAPILQLPPPITPSWVWAIIGIGAALVVVVIVLIVRTRRPPA